MKLASLLAAAALMATNPLHVGDTASRARYHDNDIENLQNIAHKAAEPPVTPVVPGSLAPDFSFQTSDNEWRHLRDLLAQGPVFLMIGPRDAHLSAIESERGRLLDLGVVPVAIVDGNDRTARSAAGRLQLHYTVLGDPQSVIAGQFNAIATGTGAARPCWFVIDRQRRVRALDRTGLPKGGFASIAIEALALPSAGISLPASR